MTGEPACCCSPGPEGAALTARPLDWPRRPLLRTRSSHVSLTSTVMFGGREVQAASSGAALLAGEEVMTA